jgi:hypothetical protein
MSRWHPPGSQRVPECDRPSVGIGLLPIKLRVSDDGDGLGCEGLIELNGADVCRCQACVVK